MGRGKQIIVLSLICILFIGCVYLGIQIKNRPELTEEENIYHGSYRETVIPLPVINEAGGEEFLQLMRGMNQIPELYTVLYNEDRSQVRGYKKYILTEELKWTEDESAWMALEFFSETSRVIRMMSYADTGSLYVLLHDLSTTEPAADEVVRVSTAGNVEHVGVRGLYKTEEDGSQIPLKKMFIADNSICITDANYNSFAYSLANGELHASGKNGAYGSLASDGSYLYLLSEDFSTVTPYQYSDGTAIKPRRLWNRVTDPDNPLTAYERADYQLLCQDGELYLSCQDGIYRFDMNSVSWIKLLSGTDCLFGKPSVTQQNFIAIGDHFYMLGKNLTGDYCFAMYDTRSKEEDEELVRTPFRISSYLRNAVITEAIVEFQHKNPSLQVMYEAALDQNPSLSIAAYRKQMNDAIAKGTAADILVCDELDYRTMMTDNVFENISDLMKPLYTAADLYGNLTNALSQTKIFVTPAKFDVFLHYGNSSYLNSISTLENMAAFSKQKNVPILGNRNVQELARIFCSFYEQDYMTDGSINPELLAEALAHLCDSARLTEESDTEEPISSDTVDSPADSWAFIENIARIDSADTLAQFTHMLSESDALYTAANARFLPHGIVGINAKNKDSKTAREFIRTLYSANVQNQNVGAGIPMSSAAVLSLGTTFLANRMTEPDLTQFDLRLKSLDKSYSENEPLFTALCELLPSLAKGELTPELAAKSILQTISQNP